MQLSETVAVVVIGRNEGERLVRCLAAVNAMRYRAELLERIYVDSGSTDGSVERAAKAGFRVLAYGAEARTAAGARELGWRASRSRYVLFLDGDCVVDPDFLGHAVARCREQGAAAVDGQVRELEATGCAPRRSLGLYWEVFRRRQEGWSQYRGGCGLVAREALEEIGGFNPRLAATENNDLGRRLEAHGKRVWFLDRLLAEHDSGLRSWGELFRRCVRDVYWFERLSRLPDAGYSGRIERQRNALERAAPGLCLMGAGGLLLGGWGLPAGAAAAAAIVVGKRTQRAREASGGGAGSVRDGALLSFYDFSVWCGQLRYAAGALAGRPEAFQTGPEWRSK